MIGALEQTIPSSGGSMTRFSIRQRRSTATIELLAVLFFLMLATLWYLSR